MLFVFAYVDLFSLYRPGFRSDLDAGEVGGFTVNQSFLVGTMAYVVIPSLMVFGALILRPRIYYLDVAERTLSDRCTLDASPSGRCCDRRPWCCYVVQELASIEVVVLVGR